MMRCGFCGRETTDAVYIGKLRGCGTRVAFGRCCKPAILKQFDTIGEAAQAYGKLHHIACGQRHERARNEVMVDVSHEGGFEKNLMAN